MARIRFPIKAEKPINIFDELVERAQNDEPIVLFWYGGCFWYGENATSS